MTAQRTAVFCDFDGTITRRDVGYNLYRHFSGGRNQELVAQWKVGILSTRECLVQEAAMVRATEDEIIRFLDGFELDAGFPPFVELCRANDIDLTVVSDGLDFYIKYILERNRLGHLPVMANTGRMANGGLHVEFPYHNHTCPRCGNCKGERIREYRDRHPTEIRTVFIGDGYSDICAVREADVVFAKKDLEEYCVKHDIKYHRYHDFFDVARQMVALGYLSGT
jgi:2,3-diketo-5-methylthio-1-phosphopentane phosphatase